MAKMTDYADLEIGLHRRDADSYGVGLRFSQPKSDAEVRLVREGASTVRFDFDRDVIATNDRGIGSQHLAPP
jgi:hypothetical protein